MVDKIDNIYEMLDDLDEDLQAMQEDLETVIEFIDKGDSKKAKRILEEMNAFLIDFLEPDECDEEECECCIVTEDAEEPKAVEECEEEKAPKKTAPTKTSKQPAKKPASKKK